MKEEPDQHDLPPGNDDPTLRHTRSWQQPSNDQEADEGDSRGAVGDGIPCPPSKEDLLFAKAVTKPQGADFIGSSGQEEVLLGRYRIKGTLGKGGMGRVRKAVDEQTGAVVAIKDIEQLEGEHRDAETARLREHFKLVARLTHEHICKTCAFEYDPKSKLAYLVLDYVEGESLADRLSKRNAPVSRMELLDIVEQVAHGLDFAHTQGFSDQTRAIYGGTTGIVHCDIKPGNIMIDVNRSYRNRSPWVWVIDFGLASAAQVSPAGQSLAEYADCLGCTPRYAAPEQLVKGKALSGATDQFSLALVALELMIGSTAFMGLPGFGGTLVLDKPLPACPEGVMPAEWRVLKKAFAVHRSDRWESCSKFAAALREASSRQDAVDRSGWRRVALPFVLFLVCVIAIWWVTTQERVDRADSENQEGSREFVGDVELLPKRTRKSAPSSEGAVQKPAGDRGVNPGRVPQSSEETSHERQRIVQLSASDVRQIVLEIPGAGVDAVDPSRAKYLGKASDLSQVLEELASALERRAIDIEIVEEKLRWLDSVDGVPGAVKTNPKGAQALCDSILRREDSPVAVSVLDSWLVYRRWTNSRGLTPVMIAAYYGAPGSLLTLVERRKRSDTVRTPKWEIDELNAIDGKSALYYAIDGNNRKCCRILIDNGANPDRKVGNGETARELAERNRIAHWLR